MKYLRILMLVAGVALMAWGATVFVRNQIRGAEVHGWPRVKGHVTLSQVDTLHRTEVGNAGDFYPHVRYHYVVHGRTYRGETLYLDEHRSYDSSNVAARELVFIETGTEPEVLYNPENPRESALTVDKPTWRYFFIFIGGFLLAGLSWRLGKIQPRPQPQMPGQPMPGQPMPPGHPMAQMQAQPQMSMQPQPQPQMQFSPGGQLVPGPAPKATPQA